MLSPEEVCICYSFGADLAQLSSEEKVGPVGQFSGDRQSNPPFATGLFDNFRLVDFYNICIMSVYPKLYNKRVVKGFPVSIKIMVDTVIFEDIVFIL